LDQLKNLIVMAIADGSFSEDEINFLSDRCVALGLDEYAFRDALNAALDDDAALTLPQDAAAQDALLADLVQMMAADGHLDEREKRLFALAAAKMGIDDARLHALIDELVR
jgi:tellurite resistance protein